MTPLSIAIIGAGHAPVTFERFDQAEPVGSGLMLQPTRLTVLDELGLLPAMMARGHRIDGLNGTDAKTRRKALDVHCDSQNGGRFGLAVNRPALFDVLHAEVLKQGIELVTGTPVEAVEAGTDGVELVG
jgi:2-polyprenyl-6-methoxyphenol hydroxylase-like FAD-dependent oxidoreductase